MRSKTFKWPGFLKGELLLMWCTLWYSSRTTGDYMVINWYKASNDYQEIRNLFNFSCISIIMNLKHNGCKLASLKSVIDYRIKSLNKVDTIMPLSAQPVTQQLSSVCVWCGSGMLWVCSTWIKRESNSIYSRVCIIGCCTRGVPWEDINECLDTMAIRCFVHTV